MWELYAYVFIFYHSEQQCQHIGSPCPGKMKRHDSTDGLLGTRSYFWGTFSQDTGQQIDGSPQLITKLSSLLNDQVG